MNFSLKEAKMQRAGLGCHLAATQQRQGQGDSSSSSATGRGRHGGGLLGTPYRSHNSHLPETKGDFCSREGAAGDKHALAQTALTELSSASAIPYVG